MIQIILTDATIQIDGDENELKKINKYETFDDSSACFSKGRYDITKLKHVPLMKNIKGRLVGFAGLAKEIILFCRNNNIKIENFEDKRTHFDFQMKEWTEEELKSFLPNFDYVEHQVRGLQALLKTNKGIVMAPTSAGKCVSGNTKLIINGKPLKIKKLFKNFKEEEFKEPEKQLRVLTELGDQNVKLLYKTNKRKVLKLKLNNGYSIIGVPEHRVKTNNGWKFLKDLKKGDLVLCKKKETIFQKILKWIYQKL